MKIHNKDIIRQAIERKINKSIENRVNFILYCLESSPEEYNFNWAKSQVKLMAGVVAQDLMKNVELSMAEIVLKV